MLFFFLSSLIGVVGDTCTKVFALLFSRNECECDDIFSSDVDQLSACKQIDQTKHPQKRSIDETVKDETKWNKIYHEEE